MSNLSLDELIASRIGRALATVTPAAARLLGRPIERDGQELEPELVMVTRTKLPIPRSPGDMRRQQNKLSRIAGGARPRSIRTRDVTIAGAAGPLPARLYEEKRPPERDAPLIVYFHGGGFVFGDLGTHDASCAYLAEHAGAKVLAVDYRLAPEHPFPAAIDDALAAFRWAHAHAKELGADPARVAVAGDSAGGNLAAATAQLAAQAEGPTPCAQILIYPAIDRRGGYPSLDLFASGFYLTREIIDWFHEQYVQGSAPDPRFNPIMTKDLSGLAPALVITAGFDPLRDEGEAYAKALAAQGNTVVARRFSSLAHGFFNMVGTSPACRAAVVEIAGATRVLLSPSSSRTS